MKSRFLLSVLVLCFVAADGSKDDETKKDRKKLQGTWAFVTIEEDGFKKSQRELKGMEDRLNWTFTENVLVRNLGMELAKGGFRIDATKQPKEIDCVDYAGKKSIVRGIYAFEGDQLKIFLGSVKGGERPKTFGAKPKSGQASFLMKRHVVQIQDS
jgi:uncharacterized protein (TIGR03067 family)